MHKSSESSNNQIAIGFSTQTLPADLLVDESDLSADLKASMTEYRKKEMEYSLDLQLEAITLLIDSSEKAGSAEAKNLKEDIDVAWLILNICSVQQAQDWVNARVDRIKLFLRRDDFHDLSGQIKQCEYLISQYNVLYDAIFDFLLGKLSEDRKKEEAEKEYEGIHMEIQNMSGLGRFFTDEMSNTREGYEAAIKSLLWTAIQLSGKQAETYFFKKSIDVAIKDMAQQVYIDLNECMTKISESSESNSQSFPPIVKSWLLPLVQKGIEISIVKSAGAAFEQKLLEAIAVLSVESYAQLVSNCQKLDQANEKKTKDSGGISGARIHGDLKPEDVTNDFLANAVNALATVHLIKLVIDNQQVPSVIKKVSEAIHRGSINKSGLDGQKGGDGEEEKRKEVVRHIHNLHAGYETSWGWLAVLVVGWILMGVRYYRKRKAEEFFKQKKIEKESQVTQKPATRGVTSKTSSETDKKLECKKPSEGLTAVVQTSFLPT